jgi:hypothetical protein
MKRAIETGSSIIRKCIGSYAWTGYSALGLITVLVVLTSPLAFASVN